MSKTKREKNKEEIKRAYTAELQKMSDKLKALQSRLEIVRRQKPLPESVHWGHIGDVARINTILDEALRVELEPVEENH